MEESVVATTVVGGDEAKVEGTTVLSEMVVGTVWGESVDSVITDVAGLVDSSVCFSVVGISDENSAVCSK